ncbi:double-cubane-cluster-containing anaerobic reductase [Desulfoplanes formicivorans]|uniref:2-hydroxyglutaryl-CoA dehydratase n=1 Tax=Desulfoplanes formicivorans TaxID=1592317 RepID=A0A194AIQ8_9BACT|nr:double-cubane-cluster-containing anaerobic reductase [Desulfoplanes formicivorans]GAU08634.1 2-hydroxyglutaryl-CoA dehydratase [Desulfoplanes formicivorans]
MHKPKSFDTLATYKSRSLPLIDEAKEHGTKIGGLFCVYAPTELMYAAGVIPVGLCGKNQDPIPAAERNLPANLCPLIKSSYGYGITHSCPFFAASDFIVGETTCDGKKKMYELLARIKPVHLMHLPYTQHAASSLDFWTGELHRFATFLEQETGNKITPHKLRQEIQLHNQVRKQLLRITATGKAPVPPLSGLDMLSVTETKSFVVDMQDYLTLLTALADDLEALVASRQPDSKPGPRILYTGCPTGKGSEKVLKILEECGATVAVQEHCSSLKDFNLLVDQDEPDLYRTLAKRYLDTPCSCMTPNTGRLDLISELINDYSIDGVVDLTWQCCHTYNVESFSLREHVEQKHQLPFLHIETDYAQSDTEQLRTRIEAFLEML